MSDSFLSWIGLAVLGALGAMAYRAYGFATAWLRQVLTVEITIDDPEAFKWIAEWLAIEGERRKCQKLTVHEHRIEKPGEVFDALRSRALFVPGEGRHVFWRGARRVWVERNKGTPLAGSGGNVISVGDSPLHPDSITLTTFGRDTWPLKSLVLEAELAYRERRNHKLSAWTGNGWGDWRESAMLAGRAMESVVLPDGVSEHLLRDVREFLGARERYVSVGVPYRRGYLLHGLPGCGKSSFAKSMATECGLNLYVLALSSGVTDDNLRNMMNAVRPHSLVLLEDVEAAVAKDGEKGVTRSGLLNALDGVTAAEGRVLVMTTNHRDKLDPALVRAGRVDVHLELKATDESQARRMFQRFFPSANGEAQAFAVRAVGATPATIQGHLIEHWDDARMAVAAWSDDDESLASATRSPNTAS